MDCEATACYLSMTYHDYVGYPLRGTRHKVEANVLKIYRQIKTNAGSVRQPAELWIEDAVVGALNSKLMHHNAHLDVH